MTAIAETPDTIRIGRKSWPFVGFAETSALYAAARDKMGATMHTVGRCEILAGGKVVAHVSFNGKVWPGAEWQPGAAPIFTPY